MASYPNETTQESTMNIAKNMETIFVSALLAAGLISYALSPSVKAPVANKTMVESKISTVVIVAKRLTAQEKAKLRT
jgi:hypothetical protein